jgi:hypothetical protein
MCDRTVLIIADNSLRNPAIETIGYFLGIRLSIISARRKEPRLCYGTQ